MSESSVLYEAGCHVCDEHRTELGIMSSCIQGAVENQQLQDLGLSIEQRIELGKEMYVQYRLDKRTNIIQSFKKDNIKSIHK